MLGVVTVGGVEGQAFVMADIPGLIGGAAQGVGLGLEFLRHVRRTRVLVHVLDASGGPEGRDPLIDFDTVNSELAAYEENLLARPMIVALNKIDVPEARERLESLSASLQTRGFDTLPISAATGEGVPELMQSVAAKLRHVQEPEAEVETPQQRRRYTLESVDERAWSATRLSRHHFAVTGVGVERFTRMTDFGKDEGVERFQRFLESSGIASELDRLGVETGDVVHIADLELLWGDQDELEPVSSPDRRRRTSKKSRGMR
jgi:GTP-binding protein